MKIICPNCGETIEVNGLGRKSIDAPVNIICNALRKGSGSYQRAAEILSESLGRPVSRGFIYQRLKRAGLNKDQVMEGKH